MLKKINPLIVQLILLFKELAESSVMVKKKEDNLEQTKKSAASADFLFMIYK